MKSSTTAQNNSLTSKKPNPKSINELIEYNKTQQKKTNKQTFNLLLLLLT